MTLRLRVLAVIFLAVLLGACDWPQFGFDAGHSGFDPVEPSITVDNASTLTSRWTFTAGEPAVAGGAAFVTAFLSNATRVVKLDATTGAVVWSSAPISGSVSDPSVAGGVAFVSTHDSQSGTSGLLGFDVSTGVARVDVPVADCSVDTQLAPVVGSGVVALTDAGNVCALDAVTGAKAWTVHGIAGIPLGRPAIASGRVFLVGQTSLTQGEVVALDAATGAVLWSRAVAGFPVGEPVVVGSRVYVPASSLVTFDATNGDPGPVLGTGFAGDALAVAPGAVVVAGEGDIRAIDPDTGAVQWSIVGPGGIVYSKPAIANGVVYVGSYQQVDARLSANCCAHLSALRLDTGGELFSFSTQTEPGIQIRTNAVVADGTVFVIARNLTALRPAGS